MPVFNETNTRELSPSSMPFTPTFYLTAEPRQLNEFNIQEVDGNVKYLATFYIQIENDLDFKVGQRIIGQGGRNVK